MSSKLNEAQKFYITQNKDKDVETLAKDSGTKIEIVQDFINSLPEPKKEQTILVKMTKQKQQGVHVLTREAAERADEGRRMIRSKTANGRYKDCISKIYEEDNG